MSGASLNLPDPKQAKQFVFSACNYDRVSGTASLAYRFDDGTDMVEQITFPDAPWPESEDRQQAFRTALEILHLVAGVSYYKAGLCSRFEFHQPSNARLAGEFLQTLYVEGLAEFAWVNKLDVESRVRFPQPAGDSRASAVPLELPDRALLALGGGKDSLVGLELMRRAGVDCSPVCVGESRLIGETAEAAGLPLLRIKRRIAPELIELNRAGAWNGHVPVTAINSAILLCAAILYGYRYIVFSNERSADQATLVSADGKAINHQYSKGSAFEAAFRQLIAGQVSPDIEYFSVVRPFSELGIVEHFSRLEHFHDIYSSCNRNFHIEGPRIQGRWCGDCPKCRFAALSLALYLSPARVRQIMGRDLLDEPDQADGFRALCALGRDKPFECVGESGESRAAMRELASLQEWSGHAVVKVLQPELDGVQIPAMKQLLEPSGRHFIPTHLAAAIGLSGEAP